MGLLGIIIITTSLAAYAIANPSHVSVRLMTYNIRHAVEDEVPGGELWSVRRPLMSAQLKYETSGRPDTILCLQEAREQQVLDLEHDLGEEWAYIGASRDGSDPRGEFAPIFYRPSVWELDEDTTLWLSETPTKPASRSWDAQFPRIVTIGRFRHADTGTPLVYMCTHFDHISPKARENSAKLIQKTAQEWTGKGNESSSKVFVAGDLNSKPEDEPYKILASAMHDVKRLPPKGHRFGHIHTFTNFTMDRVDDEIIDHIFVHDDKGIEWDAFTVLNNRFDDRIFISDHRPVVVDFRLPTGSKE